jgi:hypothetical protein
MGRRSINTTKSGKYMNPTDQASKYTEHNLQLVVCYSLNKVDDV